MFIHESEDIAYEVKLGIDNECINREIKMGHNLFKMWQAGEFDKKLTPDERAESRRKIIEWERYESKNLRTKEE